MLGEKKVTDFDFNPKLEGYAIKQPVFSFNKFPNVNKKLGPEMKSTGESILFIDKQILICFIIQKRFYQNVPVLYYFYEAV